MTKPFVSVVVPTYNRRALLPETVKSVARQDGPPHETIVVDDASTDGTADWLRGQSGIRAILRPERGERAAARNEGLANATGEYVLFLDDDDHLAPGALRRLGKAAAQLRAAIVVGTASYLPGFEGPDWLYRPKKPCWASWREVLFGWAAASPGQVLLRRDVLRAYGGFDSSIPGVDDMELLLRISRTETIRVLPEVTLLCRHHPGQQKPPRGEDLDREVRQKFADTLTGRDRERAEAILAVRDTFFGAVSRYTTGDYKGAFVDIARTLRACPWLFGSALLRPWAVSLLAKSGAGALLPRSGAAALRRWVVAQRARRAP